MGAEVIIFCKILNSKFLKGLRHSALLRSQLMGIAPLAPYKVRELPYGSTAKGPHINGTQVGSPNPFAWDPFSCSVYLYM